MNANDVLIEGFGRLPALVERAVEGLTPELLAWAPAEGANTIGWLVWHLTRVQDAHLAELLDEEQIYVQGDWAETFGLKADPSDTGYGHRAGRVARVRPRNWQSLVDYHRAVHDRTIGYLGRLEEADLDTVVDTSWDPPVTLGVRLVSVLDDDVQHVGQAAYVRGLL